MQLTETKNEGLSREFTVKVLAKDLEGKLQLRLEELGRTVNLAGFRPGKAPLPLLKQRFGQAVLGEVLQAAVTASTAEAISEHNLRPAMQPKIELKEYDEGKDLEYTMSVELMPEFEPIDFSKLKLERLTVKVGDDEVDKALAQLAAENRRPEPLKKARKSRTGDVLVIDYKGTIDGTEFAGGAVQDYYLELGGGRFIPGFEDQLVGVVANAQVTVKVEFPKEYGSVDLAGKEAEFAVDVKEIRELVDVEVDEAFAESLGLPDLKSLGNAIQARLEQDYSSSSRNRLKRSLLDELNSAHDFEIPAGMVAAEFDAIWAQLEEARKKGNLDADDMDKTDDELRDEYRNIAERRVRLGVLLSEVGRLNNVEVAQEEINRAIVQESQRGRGNPREIMEYFQNNPEAQAQLRAPLFEDKVIDFILELASITDRETSAEDLMREESEEANQSKSVKSAISGPKRKKTTAKKAATEKQPAKKRSVKKAKG
jgi:trigger factor